MDNLPVVVKEILESAELQKIKKVDLRKYQYRSADRNF